MIPFAWVLQAMNVLEPTAYPYRYEETARAIAQAAEERPLFGDTGFKTASLLVALAWHETRFDASRVGDNGHAFGLFQIHPETAGQGKEALVTASSSARIACLLLERSMSAAKGKPLEERLGLYASGSPDRALGVSREIMAIAKRVGL